MRYRLLVTLFLVMCTSASYALNVYAIPGLGVDARVFSRLTLPEGLEMMCLDWPEITTERDISEYAECFLGKIDTSQPFGLIGLSMGGFLAIEIAHMKTPVFTVLVSSASTSDELPNRYRSLIYFPVYRLVSSAMLKASAAFVPYAFQFSKADEQLYQDMILAQTGRMFRRHVSFIGRWRRHSVNVPVISIHGTADRVIPFEGRDRVDYVIQGAGHKALVTHSAEIAGILKARLGVFL